MPALYPSRRADTPEVACCQTRSVRAVEQGVAGGGGGNVGTYRAAATLSSVPLYAAYGSNMDPAQMAQRAPHSPMAMTGWLIGWRLTFGGEDLLWEGALATVVEDPGDQVFVMVYDVPEQDEAALDAWEGADTDVVLSEMGFAAAEIEELRSHHAIA